MDRRSLNCEISSIGLACGHAYGIFSWLLGDVGVEYTVSGPTHGQVVLWCIRKQVEHEPGEQDSKQHSSTACASVPASRLLPWVPIFSSLSDELWLRKCKLNKPFFPNWYWSNFFCHSNWRQTRTVGKSGKPRLQAEKSLFIFTVLVLT